jgi:hypothetical protein
MALWPWAARSTSTSHTKSASASDLADLSKSQEDLSSSHDDHLSAVETDVPRCKRLVVSAGGENELNRHRRHRSLSVWFRVWSHSCQVTAAYTASRVASCPRHPACLTTVPKSCHCRDNECESCHALIPFAMTDSQRQRLCAVSGNKSRTQRTEGIAEWQRFGQAGCRRGSTRSSCSQGEQLVMFRHVTCC